MKEDSEDIFRKVQRNHYFHLYGGSTIKSLADLLNSLRTMNKSTFSHHVNAHKNDFANWVDHVIEDTDLAKSLRKTKDRGFMIEIIERKYVTKNDKEDFAKKVKKKLNPKNIANNIIKNGKKEEKEEKENTELETIKKRIEENIIRNEEIKKYFFRGLMLGASVGIIIMILIFYMMNNFF